MSLVCRGILFFISRRDGRLVFPAFTKLKPVQGRHVRVLGCIALIHECRELPMHYLPGRYVRVSSGGSGRTIPFHFCVLRE